MNYSFSNLLGVCYKKGNIAFAKDGYSLMSPIGNMVSVYNLKNDSIQSIKLDINHNIDHIALSPNGNIFLVADEEGEMCLCSLSMGTVIGRHHFMRPLSFISFSPDGLKFAVGKENKVYVYISPTAQRQYNQFTFYRCYYGAHDDVTSIDWTSDGKAFVIGSKDTTPRVYGIERYENLVVYSLSGHSDVIVGAFFVDDSLDTLSVAADGLVLRWKCNTTTEGLLVHSDKFTNNCARELDFDHENPEYDELERNAQLEAQKSTTNSVKKVIYGRAGRFFLREVGNDDNKSNSTSRVTARVKCAVFRRQASLLACGLSDGRILLHHLLTDGDLQALLSMQASIEASSVSTIALSPSADWVAVGCQKGGQLLVWEWQSGHTMLREESHHDALECLSWSPDGQLIGTGDACGVVKVWSVAGGKCLTTFKEHTKAVMAVEFNQRGKALLSASRDGTVRAFDLLRYRNFRTLTAPREGCQLTCMSLDPSGDLVAAATNELGEFELIIWSLRTGQLLECLTGHTSAVSSLSFSPTSSSLCSVSWDSSLRLWDVFNSRNSKEVLLLTAEGLAVAWRPDGIDLAVSTLNGQILIINALSCTVIGSIEGRSDLGINKPEGEKISAKKYSAERSFHSICYSADGGWILAAGNSKYVCIYSANEQLLLTRFEITCNMSLEGVQDILDRRLLTPWGSLAQIEDSSSEKNDGQPAILPGVRSGDKSARRWRPEVCVTSVRFSPSGESWAATSVNGLVLYQLDKKSRRRLLDSSLIDENLTPDAVRNVLASGELGAALDMALRLQEPFLLRKVIESIPPEQASFLCRQLSKPLQFILANFLTSTLSNGTPHLSWYLSWTREMLTILRPDQAPSEFGSLEWRVCFRRLCASVRRHRVKLQSITALNHHTLNYLTNLVELYRHQKKITETTEEQCGVESMDIL